MILDVGDQHTSSEPQELLYHDPAGTSLSVRIAAAAATEQRSTRTPSFVQFMLALMRLSKFPSENPSSRLPLTAPALRSAQSSHAVSFRSSYACLPTRLTICPSHRVVSTSEMYVAQKDSQLPGVALTARACTQDPHKELFGLRAWVWREYSAA